MLRFTYVRVREAIRAIYPDYPAELKPLLALQAVLAGADRTGLITKLYAASLRERVQLNSPSYNKWVALLGASLSLEMWKFCRVLTGRLTANCNLRIIHFKYLHQLYYTPMQLLRFGLRESSCCVRCGQGDAGFLHLAWNCKGIYRFWGKVTDLLTKVVSEPVQCTPRFVY